MSDSSTPVAIPTTSTPIVLSAASPPPTTAAPPPSSSATTAPEQPAIVPAAATQSAPVQAAPAQAAPAQAAPVHSTSAPSAPAPPPAPPAIHQEHTHVTGPIQTDNVTWKELEHTQTPQPPSAPEGPKTSSPSTGHDDVHPPHAEPSAKDLPAGAHPADLRPGVASPVMPPVHPDLAQKPTTEVRAGLPHKPFWIHTELLVAKSPYFAAMQNTSESPQPPHRLSGPFFFPELDEFAFAHFVRWIYGGELHGPHDFHSMNHYLCLYVLARKFNIEKLQNRTMDLLRAYYFNEDMTAPPFRLDYIYENTTEANVMREFLLSTAAYRSWADAETGGNLSDSMRGVLRKEGDIGPDFAQAILDLIKSDRADPRKGDACRWHEHNVTHKCAAWGGFEPWQNA